ncbi:MAG: hypothetical protein Q9184_005235 [Pyrenodesmia sp. 2 TL-2023]
MKQANARLRQELEIQKAYYVGQLQDDLVTLQDAKTRFDRVLSQVDVLKDVSEQLCQHLRVAWMEELNADHEITAEMQQAAVDHALTQDASVEPAGDDQEGDGEDWHSEADPPGDDDDEDHSDSDFDYSDHGDLSASDVNDDVSVCHNISKEPLAVAPPRWSNRMDHITKACPQTIAQRDDEPKISEADDYKFAVPSLTESEEDIDDVPGPDAPEDVVNEYLDARFKEAREQRTEASQEPQYEAELSYSAFNAYGPSDEPENLQLAPFHTQGEEPVAHEAAEEVEAELSLLGRPQPSRINRTWSSSGWLLVSDGLLFLWRTWNLST